ncbi:MAG: hypothetical protein ACK5MQ_00230 [Pikeienuella sp.]
MRRLLFPTAFLLAPQGALLAECAGETMISCETGAGWLEVCVEPGDGPGEGAFTYAFGPKGAPDLALREDMAAGTATPWPGIGGAIWESVDFRHEGHVYSIYIATDRSDESGMRAGAHVIRGEETLARLSCESGPDQVIAPAFAVEDAMTAAGYRRDLARDEWRRGEYP